MRVWGWYGMRVLGCEGWGYRNVPLSVSKPLFFLPFRLPPPPLADCYLLQIQQYNVVSSALKPKTEGAAIKADANQSDDSNMVAPATGQKEAPPQWYDIDVVKGTQYTVTGYQVPIEDPTVKVRVRVRVRVRGGEGRRRN